MSTKFLFTEPPIPLTWMFLLGEQLQFFLTAVFSSPLTVYISVLRLSSTGRPLKCGAQNWTQLQLRPGVVTKLYVVLQTVLPFTPQMTFIFVTCIRQCHC